MDEMDVMVLFGPLMVPFGPILVLKGPPGPMLELRDIGVRGETWSPGQLEVSLGYG